MSSGTDSSVTPAPAAASSIPAPATGATQEGPIPAPSGTPTPDQPISTGNNSPPPAITNPTPETKNDPIPLSQIVSGFVFIILAGFAVFYGWILGQTEGRTFLLYVQTFGPWIRGWFVRPERI